MSQQTIVTGTITDPSGNPYKNCSYSVSLVNNTGLGTLPLLSGSTFQTIFDGGSCDSTGSFSQPLFDNNQITPLGTQWKFSVCDITGKTCFTYTTPICPTAGCITGASINISTAISAVAPILTQAGNAGIGINNIFTGTNTFSGPLVLTGTDSGNQTISGNKTFSGINNFKYLEGIRFTDQFPGANAGARMDAAVTDCGTLIGCWMGISNLESSGDGTGSSQTQLNTNWLDMRTGSSTNRQSNTNPTTNRTFLNPIFGIHLFDNSTYSTNSQALADQGASPAMKVEVQATGTAVVPAYYGIVRYITGACVGQPNCGAYETLGTVTLENGSRANYVANNHTISLSQGYAITSAVASSNVVTMVIQGTGSPAPTPVCQVNDFVHISGITTAGFNSGPPGTPNVGGTGYTLTSAPAGSGSTQTVVMTIPGSGTQTATVGANAFIQCFDVQVFGFETNIGNVMKDPGDLSSTSAQSTSPIWVTTQTCSTGPFPCSAGNFISGANQYYGVVENDAITAGTRHGWYNGTNLVMKYASLNGFKCQAATNGSANCTSAPNGFIYNYGTGAAVNYGYWSTGVTVPNTVNPVSFLDHRFGTQSTELPVPNPSTLTSVMNLTQNGNMILLATSSNFDTLQIQTTNTTTANGGIRWQGSDGVFKSRIGNNFNKSDATGNLEFMTGGVATTHNWIDSGGVFRNDAGINVATLATSSNCAVNSASPAACGSAASGVFAVPTTTTTYTVNSTAITSNSRVFLQDITDNTGIPGSPTCTALAAFGDGQVQSRVAGTSFTISLPSTAGITCFNYWIIN